ncbi:probable salivary secreted peptide [Nasonia vitripennis]|uniref:Salivary secreted peptide n=1 Tax=Nasonia vitripennis TaxID=7425 RepID=A0A7M7LNL5_NASVI|nr:probable salivary secreted peptide [Nasonia vitripennis]
MTSFKTLSLVAIVLVVAATVSSSPVPLEKVEVFTSNDLVVGSRQARDSLVYTESITEKFLVSGKKLIITRNIQVPNGYVITQVRATDKAADGTGAEATVIGGGPDMEFISLRFKSQRWRGIYFDIQVYAKPRY